MSEQYLYEHFLYEEFDEILTYRVTKKTAKRIYFVDGDGRSWSVDREKLERDGDIWHRPSQRLLYMERPPTRAEKLARLRGAA